MPLIKAGRFVSDPWEHVADDAAIPAGAPASVSFRRWSAERDALLRRGGLLGLRLPNDVAVATLGPDIASFALIVLTFPRFTDGRAYSQARLLRGRFGYRGELRASGEVLRDQLLFMRRCGFDAFAVSERAVTENWLTGFGDFDVFYQPGEGEEPWAMRLRQGAA